MANTKKIEENIKDKDLIDELGLSKLPKKDKDEIYQRMVELLSQRILLKSMDELSKEDKDRLVEMIEKGTKQAEVQNFMSKKIPNMDKLIEDETVLFKKQMIEDKDYLMTLRGK